METDASDRRILLAFRTAGAPICGVVVGVLRKRARSRPNSQMSQDGGPISIGAMQSRRLIVAGVMLGAASCSGGAAPAPEPERPGAGDEVVAAEPARPFVAGGYLRVDRETLAIAAPVAAGGEPVFETFDDFDAMTAAIAAWREGRTGIDEVSPPWPATSPCGGATPESYPTLPHLAVRAGAPRDGDVVVVAAHDVDVQRAMSFALWAGSPVVIAIEDAGGTQRVLPVRLCADQAPPPERSPRTIEVQVIAGPQAGLYLGSNGGMAGSELEDVDVLARDASATDLGDRIRGAAFGAPPDLVRLWILPRIPIDEAAQVLDGVMAAQAPAVALIGTRREMWFLSVKPGPVATTGDVDKANVGAEVRARVGELEACAERAAFADPALETLEVSLAYAGTAPVVGIEPPPDAGAKACFDAVFAAIQPRRRDRASGTATFTLALKRTGTDR